jgi:hypothetical protein
MPHALDAHVAVQIGRLKKGDHVCLYYETPAEQLAFVSAYIRQGLAKQERCLYVAHDRGLDEVKAALQGAGVKVGLDQQRGALMLQTADDVHLKNGRFDCDAMLGFFTDAVEQAINDGFTGLRTAGEMTWIADGAPGSERAFEHEALMNEFYRDSHALGLCQYDRLHMRPETLDEALKTHPRVLVGSRLSGNPYYEPPDMYLNRSRRSPERERFDLRVSHLTADKS